MLLELIELQLFKPNKNGCIIESSYAEFIIRVLSFHPTSQYNARRFGLNYRALKARMTK